MRPLGRGREHPGARLTGFVILMAHPRLYWGHVGNGLTPALIELPISPNYRHGGWESVTPFFERTGSPVSASRTFPMFNQNAWGRSLHFLAAWLLTLTGLAYLAAGVLTGHLRRRIVPDVGDLTPALLREDVRRHVRFAVRRDAGAPYGTLQKIAYTFVIVGMLPLAGLTGVTMSPAVTTAFHSCSRCSAACSRRARSTSRCGWRSWDSFWCTW